MEKFFPHDYALLKNLSPHINLHNFIIIIFNLVFNFIRIFQNKWLMGASNLLRYMQ